MLGYRRAKLVTKMYKFLPSLLLLDIWMSGLDGRDICKELKSDDKTKKIPIIMISANKDTKQIALEAGADGFIAKPFEIDTLIETVERYTV